MNPTLNMLTRICIFVLVAMLYVDGENLCSESSYGTDFILGFMDMPYYSSRTTITEPTLKIRVTSKSSTSVYVTISGTNSASKTSTWITKRHRIYKSGDISFNSSFINKYQDDNVKNSIRITSSNPIAVLAIYNTNTYIVANPIVPVTALSSSYVLPSYPPNSVSYSEAQVLIIALHDSTVVRFEGYDLSLTKTLNQNETYVYQKRQDLSGTSVTSNHPVAMFTSVTKGYDYHSSFEKTMFLSMQVPPVGKTALHFVVPALPNEVKSYKVRIYAAQEARVEIHSSSSSTKHMHVYEKIYYEYIAKGSSTLEILSDKPLLVVQVALDSLGRAIYMTNIPAVSQYLSSYLTDYAQSHTNSESWTYVITIRYEEALGLLVNGNPALHNPELVAHRTPLGNYTIFTIPMTSHYVVSHVGDEPFGLLIFGRFSSISNYYAYGHPAGMQFNTDCPQTTPSAQIIG